MKKTLLPIILALAVCALAGPALAGEPTDAVRVTVDAVMDILNDESLKGEERTKERRAKLREAVTARFDFREMARRSLAAAWKERTTEEKDEFVSLYTDLLERTYVKRIENYEDEEVVYLGEKTRGKFALVKTKLVDDEGLEVPMSYRLHSKTGQWEVYDVIIEGVSLVNNYRTQFKSILSSGTYEDLLKKLRKKVEKNAD